MENTVLAIYLTGAVITFVVTYRHIRNDWIRRYNNLERNDAMAMFLPAFASAAVWFIFAPLWFIAGMMVTDGKGK